MAFVQFTGVSLSFGDRDILINADIKLKTGSRAALCGANGSGKSTLMKVMAGIIACDRGERALEKGATIAYLPQSGLVHRGKTLWDEAKTAFARFDAMEKRRAVIENQLESVKTDGSRTQNLLAEAETINETLERGGFWQIDKQIALVLWGLGFVESDFMRLTEEFSGGRQMRIALAKVLLENPDILLLDEPTNYLDIEGRAWLEEWLRKFCGAFLLVSHDRYFLDRCVNEIYELFHGRLKRYPGTYTDYEKRRSAEIESLISAYKRQQEEIARSEDLIRRFRYKPSKAAMVQERIKKLEKMERVEIPESLKKISIKLPEPPHSGRIALKLEGLGRSYGEKRVFSGLDLCLESGERLLVVGVNGAGKSTLLRIIAGADKGHEGTVSYGAGIVSAYFSQEAAETLSDNGVKNDGVKNDGTVLNCLEETAPAALYPRLRDMLGAFLFRGDDVFKKISVLSGGERSRLALLRLLLRPANLLILDEPTNHLDIYAKNVLLEALLAYTGTVIFVSHDRAFMEALSKKTLALDAGRPHRLHYGGYADYLESLESLNPGEGMRGSAPAAGVGGYAAPPDAVHTALTPPSAPSGLREVNAVSKVQSALRDREAAKEKAAAIRRLLRAEAALVERMDALEAEKTALENRLAASDVYMSGEKTREVKSLLAAASAELSSCSSEWERLAAELALLKA
ncbi:MAG: ABC-F family ATP-binding cassette domain-containing protein [Spirochaetaceae bacterium]|jgi:ATP-binding cassette subfamily F protein 3|nr:ABC-F family ATP-binding cassette domain-containing protein [Spirochaetaceae bacterium]